MRARAQPAIFASGGIVVAAMLVLALADFNATREMGPILALGIAVMIACGLTLLPALLVAFGRRAFWPRSALEPEPPGAGVGARSARSSGAGRCCWRRLRSALLVARRARQPQRARLPDARRAVPRPARVRARARS